MSNNTLEILDKLGIIDFAIILETSKSVTPPEDKGEMGSIEEVDRLEDKGEVGAIEEVDRLEDKGEVGAIETGGELGGGIEELEGVNK